MSYANEVLGQIPTGAIIYMSMAFIFLAPRFDRELENAGKEPSPVTVKNPLAAMARQAAQLPTAMAKQP